MAQVQVTIGGRNYRLACNPGEEAHLEGLARNLDARIAEMRTAFGEIGDQRLTVMAALVFADETVEARRAAEREIARASELAQAVEAARAESDARMDELAKAIEGVAARVESLAGQLNASARNG